MWKETSGVGKKGFHIFKRIDHQVWLPIIYYNAITQDIKDFEVQIKTQWENA